MRSAPANASCRPRSLRAEPEARTRQWKLLGILMVCASLIGLKDAHADLSAEDRSAMLEWARQRDENVLKQKHPKSCGAASLANLMTFFYDRPVDEDQLLESIGRTGNQVLSMLDIVHMARAMDFVLTGYRVPRDLLPRLGRPAIVRIQEEPPPSGEPAAPSGGRPDAAGERYRHFVVLERVGEGFAHLKDPSWGNRRISFERFVRMWEDVPGEGRGAVLAVAR